jgi:hypothetical protein
VLTTPLAYKYVAIMAMMSQINYHAPRMHLPIDVPVKEQDIRFLHVSPPIAMSNVEDMGGRLQVKNYSFTFATDWRAIYNLDEFGKHSLGIPALTRDESGNKIMERASLMKYTVNTNDAYRLATNWIAGLDVDIAKLEAAHRPVIDDEMFHSKRGLVPSPLMSVEWQRPGYDPAGVRVEISAVSGELLTLYDGNGPFHNPPQRFIKDLKSLLAISDEEFLKYNDQERRALVERFAPVQGSLTNFPASISDSLFEP